MNHMMRHYSKNVNGFQVGIVGAGPAGFYCAQQLLKVINKILIIFNQFLKYKI